MTDPTGPGPVTARDAELDRILVGGREPVRITIVEYLEGRPRRYDHWATRVREAPGDRVLALDHVGSTAVPGLAAKPIVDMALTVSDPDDEAAYLPDLERLGLLLRVREPAHRMLRTPERDLHLHVWPLGHAGARAQVELRDRLRISADDRGRYAAVKRASAQREWSDMNHYADAKSEVVQAVLARARQPRAREV